ncbi:PAAR domain-containing protein [Lignipirellula cremea]|uniref:PAAR motif protein n=1 Tax=Lignipirellula cremea TaxID=2528010 RepID=A0A518DTI0_9BACT|nr:PAAR domain-containing protein [Lignipirellula cremea]QDU95133.1 PAAR motif protein [Lignipirellula cremea]
MPFPATFVGALHVCPAVTVIIPHVGGPILGPGCPTVTVGEMPSSVEGDMCTCVGPPATISMGSPTVTFGGKPAARVMSPTAHGGMVTLGIPTVMIGP